MLGGDHRRQPVEIALDEVAEAEERAGADMRRCRRPARKGVERGLHRHVDLTRAAKSELRADLPCGGVIYVGPALRRGGRAALDDVIDEDRMTRLAPGKGEDFGRVRPRPGGTATGWFRRGGAGGGGR